MPPSTYPITLLPPTVRVSTHTSLHPSPLHPHTSPLSITHTYPHHLSLFTLTPPPPLKHQLTWSPTDTTKCFSTLGLARQNQHTPGGSLSGHRLFDTGASRRSEQGHSHLRLLETRISNPSRCRLREETRGTPVLQFLVSGWEGVSNWGNIPPSQPHQAHLTCLMPFLLLLLLLEPLPPSVNDALVKEELLVPSVF